MRRAVSDVMRNSAGLPSGFNLSAMSFLHKLAPEGLVDFFSTDVVCLRLLTLTDTCPKVLALGVNDRVAALDSTTVMSQHRSSIYALL